MGKLLKQHTGRKLLLTGLFLVLGMTFLLPLLWMVSSSLKAVVDVFRVPFHWVEGYLHWDNYVQIWTDEKLPFWRMFLNSAFISVVSIVGQLLIASLAAYAFAKIDFKGKNLIFILLLTTMMIPTQAMIIPRYMIFYNLKLYDTLWAVILPHFCNVTTIFLLRQFYMSLSNDLVDAAKIDGAGHLRIWASIMMPLTKNGLISSGILAFVNTWNEYLNPLVFLPSTKNYTVSLGIRWYLNDTANLYNLMMCAAASTILPVLALYLSAQRYFEDGIGASGVKG